MRIYIAGPNIFMPNYELYKQKILSVALNLNITAVFPSDKPNLTYTQIARENLNLINSSDAILACLTPFRGIEPDSGTVFELAYAYANNKLISAYTDNISILDKINNSIYGPVCKSNKNWEFLDNQNCGIENFNLPLNLMIYTFCEIFNDETQCLNFLHKKFHNLTI